MKLLARSMMVSLVLGLSVSGAEADELTLIDAHSQIDQFVDRSTIVPLMDKAGIRHVIISARGKVNPKQITGLAAKHPDRITASVRSKGGHYSAALPKWFKFMKKQLAMPGFGAMAEVIMWHAQKGQKAEKVVVPPDDKRVRLALKGAKEKGWPFVIHIEFAASQSPETFMKKMEGMLANNPDTPFALIHMGQLESKEAARLLAKHPNFHFMVSHANPITGAKSAQPWIDLFDGGASLAPRWKALFVKYPDRFILNFDNVFEDHWSDLYVKQAALWRKALAELPAGVASKVAHENAERLWKLPTAR
ncbi:MAG TPA: amidohydrolase family protein [Rhodospirillales bacterium]|nr:amidohydrolase family protein [Rhodospirillales bacterium]